MSDDNPFVHRPAVRKPVICPGCRQIVETPPTEPWLVVDGDERQPELVEFPCPECGAIIPIGDERPQ